MVCQRPRHRADRGRERHLVDPVPLRSQCGSRLGTTSRPDVHLMLRRGPRDAVAYLETEIAVLPHVAPRVECGNLLASRSPSGSLAHR